MDANDLYFLSDTGDLLHAQPDGRGGVKITIEDATTYEVKAEPIELDAGALGAIVKLALGALPEGD